MAQGVTTLLDGHLYTAPAGCKGFDTDTSLTTEALAAFAAAGFRYAVRYVRRQMYHPQDLTNAEAKRILAAGLGLMAVQHVESDQSWIPSAEKGASEGRTAVDEANTIGLPPGTMIWRDLEGVSTSAPAQSIIENCNRWHIEVAAGGFLPGLYIGWHCGLTPDQLYSALRFTHYWSAYNLNADQLPSVRGVQMKQAPLPPKRRPWPVDVDVDTVVADALGSLPVVLAADGWPGT